MDDIFGSLAMAVTRAIDRDLPDVKYKQRQFDKPKNADGTWQTEDAVRRPHIGEIEVYHFPQSWSDTSIGFGGVAGQAFTEAYTTVVIESCTNAAVYMSGRFAYVVKGINQEFGKDLAAHNMAGHIDINRRKTYSDRGK